MNATAKFIQQDNGKANALFLRIIDSASRKDILRNIAANYGITEKEAREEVEDSDAEQIIEYVTGPTRAATSLLLSQAARAIMEAANS